MSARARIKEGLNEAVSTMRSMIVNEGQSSILESTLIPQFEANSDAPLLSGWQYVSCHPYCDFLGNTVEAGNSIMENAWNDAIANYIISLADGAA